MSCNKARQKLGVYNQSPLIKQGPRATEHRAYNYEAAVGVGSAITYIIRTRYHIGGCAGCHTTAAEMDRAGPDECLARINYYAHEMRKNARSRLWTRVLDALANISDYENLIREGVELHLAEKAKREAVR
jgi:hypothetical protein